MSPGNRASPASSHPDEEARDAPALAEALALVASLDVHASTAGIPAIADAEQLKAYIASIDPYGDYLDAKAYADYVRGRRANHAGVGMQLERDRAGEVRCFPDPGGPAARAGIDDGDRLVELAGQPVRGLALPSLLALAYGDPGTILDVQVATASGLRRVALVRARRKQATVSVGHEGRHPVLKIEAFEVSTRRELQLALHRWEPAEPLVLDLRANHGGDFNAALDCAMLFLDPGQVVVRVQSRRKTREIRSTLSQAAVRARTVLLQDGSSASAAEVFIAALTQNGRAVSIGQRTFGKGTRQEILPLAGGGALVLTTGLLFTPQGKAIDGIGLDPTVLVANGQDEAAYRRRLDTLLAPGRP